MRGLPKIVCVALFVAACGGASDSPPKPLAKHFDDMYIAAIPLEQKQAVVKTQNDWAIAKMENANAEAQFNETETQLHQAKNDQKASRLAIDSAVSAKKAAEQSADQNRINQAVKDLHTAEDMGKAADSRVKYLTAYRNYLKRYWRYTQENMYWREAQYEGAKAQLAKANNIAPKGVVYDDFPKQLEQRQKRTESAKQKAEGEKQKTVATRNAWLQIQGQADKENGHPSQLWDPMAPKAGPTNVGTDTIGTKPMDMAHPTPPATPGTTPVPATAPGPDATDGGGAGSGSDNGSGTAQ